MVWEWPICKLSSLSVFIRIFHFGSRANIDIIDDILEGMKDSKTPMQVIVDRPAAIHWALEHAQKDDIIVLMGKGHETYQEVNHVKHHMDEREIVAAYFNK